MTNRTQAELFARSFQSQVARNPGAACLTLPILRDLGVAPTVNALCVSGHVVPHGAIVQLLAVNRLQAPRPLYRVQDWLEGTALATALGVQPDQAHDTRLGETLDACYAHYEDIWQRVVQQAITQYHLSLDWLHYDITSVYFEGLYTESELVRFGYSRDHRPDSKQINLALNVTPEGLPLAFRVLAGNTADSTTPRQNLEAVRKLLPAARHRDMTILHDRAMATPETLVWYEQQKQRFISSLTADGAVQGLIDSVPLEELVAHPLAYQPQRQRDAAAPPAYHGVWREHTIQYGGQSVHVRVLVVYSLSKARLDGEKRQTLLARLQKRLAEIQSQLNQRKYNRRDYTLEQIHLAERGNAASALMDITLQGDDGQLTLTYGVNAQKVAQAEQRDGRYPLVTNCWDLSADDVISAMKGQDVAEKRFAVFKGPLQVHPLWLHKDERLVSLVLIIMLALLVYCVLEHLVRQAQRSLTGRVILDTFAPYSVVLLRFADGSMLWTYPELSPPQAELLQDLRLPSPQVTLML
jgi:transposase